MNRQIATFQLDETLLGVDILLVKEVYRHMTISPIPDAPPQLKGLMNLRGRVVTVIDLKVCLNRASTEQVDQSRLLIFKTEAEILGYRGRAGLDGVQLGEDIVGFLIDRMDEVVTIDTDEILPPPPNLTDIEADLIQGVIRQGEHLLILLDVTAVLEKVMRAADGKKEG